MHWGPRVLHKYSCFIEFIKRVEEWDYMRGLSSNLSLFRNELNKFNNAGTQILNYIHLMTLNLIKIRIFGM